MIDLSNLHPSKGATPKRRRLGLGTGSGRGKTAGRGHKGQRSRAGGRKPTWFEGGQTPLWRRLPKRGFHSRGKVVFSVVNLDQLEERFESGEEVTPHSLFERGLLSSPRHSVKVLGRGKLSKPLVVKVSAVSASARDAINRAGGSVT